MAPWLVAVAAIAETIQFPASTWQLTTAITPVPENLMSTLASPGTKQLHGA